MAKVMDYVPREVSGKPSTDRVKKRYNEFLNSELYVDTERAKLYTEYMKAHWTEPVYIRQCGALKHVFSHMTPIILEDELIVGRQSRYVRGTQLYPEYESQWMREALQGIKRADEKYNKGVLPSKYENKAFGRYLIHDDDMEDLKNLVDFWKEDWRAVTNRILKERDDYEMVEKWQDELVFFRLWWDVPEGRTMVDYGLVIEEGLEALIEKCNNKLKLLKNLDTLEKTDKYYFYKGLILVLEGVIAFAENYAREAERLAQTADEKRKEELLEIARICRKVPRYRADTFREAVQSFWFTHIAVFIETNGRGMSPGRFDQYMYRPYKDDIEAGRITDAEVLELVELLRVKHTELGRVHAKATEISQVSGSTFQNVTLGGVDRWGKGADNELSQLILQAGINVKTPQPTLSVRWSDNISKDFKLKAIECIKAGSGYPALFGDKAAIERFTKIVGTTLEEARDWTPCACVDVQLPHKRLPQWIAPQFNAAKILELVLNDGVNPTTGNKLMDTGIEVEKASFEEIKEAFKRAMGLVIKKETEYWNTAMCTKLRMGITLPLTSALYDDCIEKGLDCQAGGCRYNESTYIVSVGIINVANSLAAMKQCVFEDKKFTMKELREALKSNFEGYEAIRGDLWRAPKYGNNSDYVDNFVVELYDAYVEKAEGNVNWLGGPWRTSTLSTQSQIPLGNACCATPDPRKKGEHLVDAGLSPAGGTDICGPTAMILSALKPDHSKMDAYLLNMKFHPSAIVGDVGSDKFVALNDTFFNLGGYHIQYNIVDAKMLRDAQAHPENYSDLMIRVAGFTARWVELGPAAQEEIIRRTEYGDLP